MVAIEHSQISKENQQISEDRAAFIGKLQKAGLFLKVEKLSDLPHVWVTPSFMVLDFPDKEQFINVVYAYYVTQDPEANLVILKDSRTGKRIGRYSEVDGGLIPK